MVNRRLIRKQLDKKLSEYSPLLKADIPPHGWIRAVRNALGMSARQLASRMGVAQQAVARIEKDEMYGSVTIRTMRRAAEQMDCVFVYALVPKSSLEECFSRQVSLVINRRMGVVNHSMVLEKQALDDSDYQSAAEELIDEYKSSPPKDLWDYK